MLSSEMSHGMTQIRVPEFKHAMLNSVCDGVDAETHINSLLSPSTLLLLQNRSE